MSRYGRIVATVKEDTHDLWIQFRTVARHRDLSITAALGQAARVWLLEMSLDGVDIGDGPVKRATAGAVGRPSVNESAPAVTPELVSGQASQPFGPLKEQPTAPPALEPEYVLPAYDPGPVNPFADAGPYVPSQPPAPEPEAPKPAVDPYANPWA